jgi:alpha-tubulin suppressor-like RCC1 family protein
MCTPQRAIDDSFGQLGISSERIGKSYNKPKFCSFNIIIKDIACGEEHTALLTGELRCLDSVAEGYVYTMGNNLHGRLGLGDKTMTHSAVPCLVETLLQDRISSIACGWTHTAAVTGKSIALHLWQTQAMSTPGDSVSLALWVWGTHSHATCQRLWSISRRGA